MAAITVVSRILGMIRDMAIASYGANRQNSAFVLAFRIPNLFRRLFGEGALAGAFVPVFTETTRLDGQSSANRLLSNAMGLLGVFLSGLMVLIQVGLLVYGLATHAWGPLPQERWDSVAAATSAHPTPLDEPQRVADIKSTCAGSHLEIQSRAIAEGWTPQRTADEIYHADRQLLLLLTAIMLPFMVSICLLALVSSALNCRGHFWYPAFAPCVLNICMIAAAWFIAPHFRAERVHLMIIALSVTAASVIQFLLALWVLKANGMPASMHLRPVEPGVWQIMKLMGPVVLGLGFPQLSSLFEGLVIQWFSRSPGHETISFLGREFLLPLREGTQVCVYSASQLYQFPMGVLAISLSVAIFPLLSRYAARGDMAAMREGVNRALRVSSMEGLAAGTGLFVLAEPITSLISQRRKFDAAAVHETTAVLQMFVLGMLAYSTYQIFLKAFYALKQPIKPLKVVAVMAVVNMVLVFTLIWVPSLGSRAFGIATASTMSLDAVVLAVMLKMQLGRIGGRSLLKSLLRSAVAASAMAAAIYALRVPLAGRPNWLVVSVCVPAGALVFLAVARLLRMPELRELLGKD